MMKRMICLLLAVLWLGSMAALAEDGAESLAAQLYARGMEDLKAGDASGAAVNFEYAAREGHFMAAYRLAILYEEGKGVERDEASAEDWLHYAEQLRYGEAAEVAEGPEAEGEGVRTPGSRLPYILGGVGVIALGLFVFIGMLSGHQRREVVVTPVGLPIPMPLIPLALGIVAGVVLFQTTPQAGYVLGGVRYRLSGDSAAAVGFAKDAEAPVVLELPAEVDGLPLTSVGGFGGSDIRVLELPGSVVTIARGAFRDCASLEMVWRSGNREDGIRVEREAFRGCAALQSLAGLEPITLLQDDAFRDCAALETVTITGGSRNSVDIGKEAFRGCAALREAILPCVEKVGERAFADCPSLERLETEVIHGELYGNTFEGSENVVVYTNSSWTQSAVRKAGAETAPGH